VLSIGAKINDFDVLEGPLRTPLQVQNTCVFRSPPRKFQEDRPSDENVDQ